MWRDALQPASERTAVFVPVNCAAFCDALLESLATDPCALDSPSIMALGSLDEDESSSY